MKECTKCRKTLELTMFYKQAKGKDGLKSQCKLCDKEEENTYRKTKRGFIQTMYKNQKARSKKKGMHNPEYGFEEIYNWLISKELFHKLFKEWEESGYDKYKAPSIDRIDDYGTYSFSNIQLMTWEENNNKGLENIRNKSNMKNRKRVKQIKDNKVIEVFDSCLEAEKSTGIYNGNIASVCRGDRNTAGGYKWKYVN